MSLWEVLILMAEVISQEGKLSPTECWLLFFATHSYYGLKPDVVGGVVHGL